MDARLLTFGNQMQQEWLKEVLNDSLYCKNYNKGLVQLKLLTGDAGTGKSYIIRKLIDVFEDFQLPLVVCGTTHNAVGILNCIGQGEASTYHSTFGLNGRYMYNIKYSDNVTIEEAWDAYCQTWPTGVKFATNMHQHFEAMWEDAANERTCSHVNVTSCCNECKRIITFIINKHGATLPPIAYKQTVLIDEYGLLNAVQFELIHRILSLFSIPGGAPINLILCGSISQLPPPCASQKSKYNSILDCELFFKSFVSSTNLLVNMRQKEDPEFIMGLSLMQFNLISTPMKNLLFDCIVNKDNAMDPTFMTDAMRVFHQNVLRDEYMTKLINIIDDTKRKQLSVSVVKSKTSKIPDWEFEKNVCRRWPKLFVKPKIYKPNRPLQDFLKSPYVWKGCKVFLVPFGARFNDADGVVEHITDTSIHVRGSGSDVLYKVSTTVEIFDGRSITLVPIVNSMSINVMEAQGMTCKSAIVYFPPSKYIWSPLQPGAYVACSRVTHKKNLHISENSFGNKTGDATFYAKKTLEYKKSFEMSYDKKQQ